MARPRPDLPPPAAIRALVGSDGLLAVRAAPGARSESIEIVSGRLLVKVRCKPQDGAANEAVRRLLAQALGLAPSRLTLLRGATSREKLFQLTL